MPVQACFALEECAALGANWSAGLSCLARPIHQPLLRDITEGSITQQT
jgi:hypothetical protein